MTDFKVGDRVICNDSSYSEYFPCEATVISVGSNIMVKRDDGNGDTWNVSAKYLSLVKKQDDGKKKTKKVICEILFTRENGNQLLYIKTTPKIEALFRQTAKEVSGEYKNASGEGVEYYKLTEKLQTYVDKYRAIAKQVVLTKFGTNLRVDGYPNMSILRSVGLSKGIEVVVNDLILDDDVNSWTRDLASFVKYLHTNFIEKSVIKATISIEV